MLTAQRDPHRGDDLGIFRLRRLRSQIQTRPRATWNDLTARTAVHTSSGPDRGEERLDTADVHHARERVGRIGAEGVIRHLGDKHGGSRSALRTCRANPATMRGFLLEAFRRRPPECAARRTARPASEPLHRGQDRMVPRSKPGSLNYNSRFLAPRVANKTTAKPHAAIRTTGQNLTTNIRT